MEEPRKANISRGELGSCIRDSLSVCYPTLDDRQGLLDLTRLFVFVCVRL
jgi:hypothetical protein